MTLNKDRIYLTNDPSLSTHSIDGIIIGYIGVGEALIPYKIEELITNFFKGTLKDELKNNLEYILKLCIEESQVIEFEEI